MLQPRMIIEPQVVLEPDLQVTRLMALVPTGTKYCTSCDAELTKVEPSPLVVAAVTALRSCWLCIERIITYNAIRTFR